MSTRTYRHVFVGDKLEEVQIIRDGFNIWMPEPPKGTEFNAHREQIFGQDMWAYTDIVPCTNPSLILKTFTHRAIFDSEVTATQYMLYRAEMYLNGELGD